MNVVTAEEMAEMVYLLLTDLGYKPKHEFNKRIFLSPNNEAFLGVFPFILSLSDRQLFKEKFKFCYPIIDKKKEGDFRRVLCSFLQELASLGELGDDVPPIKMALFTSPGRSTFLHVLLCVIEWAIRRKAFALEVVMPPNGESIQNLELAINYYDAQIVADQKLRDELRVTMKGQIEVLVTELQQTESAVRWSQTELQKAQQQEKTMKEDEENLEHFCNALSRLTSISANLKRIIQLAQDERSPIDAKLFVQAPSEQFVDDFPQLQSLTDSLNEQLLTSEIDVTTYLELVTETLRSILPLYNDTVRKLKSGSAIEKLLEEQKIVIENGQKALGRIQSLIATKTHQIEDLIPEQILASQGAIILNLEPPSLTELRDLKVLGSFEMKLTNTTEGTKEEMLPPTMKAPLRRKRLNLQNVEGLSTIVNDISGISAIEPSFATPRIKSIMKDSRRRRSIREVLTSTPIVPQD